MTADLRTFRPPTPAKPTGRLALLTSLVRPSRIDQMSIINYRPLDSDRFTLLLDLLVFYEQATRLSRYGAESVV